MSNESPETITIAMMRTALYSAVVADALDGLGYTHQSPRLPFHSYTVSSLLVGRCKTTLWEEMDEVDPNPYELELQAVDAAADGSLKSGIWGELLSTAAKNCGCVGAIVDGAVRDVEKMREMKFAVFARGTSVYDSQDRQRVTAIDVEVEIEGVTFSTGDLVFADEDGVVVVPQEIESAAITAAWSKVHAENVTRDAIREGMKATAAYKKYGVL